MPIEIRCSIIGIGSGSGSDFSFSCDAQISHVALPGYQKQSFVKNLMISILIKKVFIKNL